MKEITIYIDGASKGNPGPAGIGVVICAKDDEILKNISIYIGETTNNVAEYQALIFALQEALILKAQILTVNTDSQLLVRQLNREYKIKSKNIIGLYNQVMHLVSGFKEVKFNHISREQNQGADKLANLAVKKSRTRIDTNKIPNSYEL